MTVFLSRWEFKRMGEIGMLIRVGIGEMAGVKAPDTIRTSGLGSCVGIVLYEERSKFAAMGHIMLPDSTVSRNARNRAKYADTAVEDLCRLIKEQRVPLHKVKAKIAGGSQMFQFGEANDTMRIGPRNVKAVRQCLAKVHIPIVAADVGGSKGRTIEFDPSTNALKIRTVGAGERII